ncbi:MAG: FemAB family PEP-CTERM system-associated protein [Acidobacteria bacterium]|nr:FemAB family PEP-CTERM system-associated protein [Acidobacteriota bacterium]
MSLNIKPFSPTDASRWDHFVSDNSQASICHTSGWQRVVERTWKHRQLSFYVERDGEICGVLPLFEVRSWFGSTLVSSPNAVYGGAVAADAASQQALIAAAKSLAIDRQVDYLELRNAQPDGFFTPQPEFLEQKLYVSFEQPITKNDSDLMNGFPGDVRRMIRLGQKHGFTTSLGCEELLDEFYELYAANVRRLGTPVFPKKLFSEFLREFRDKADILLIRHQRRAAAAVLSFYFRDAVLPYYSGSDPEFYRAGINNFLYWELMRLSAARGYTRFDFGRSKLGTGAYAFKRGWRMTERPLPYKFFLVRAKQMPNLNPTNPKFDLMIKTWQRMPLWMTKLIGPKIVRNFP